MTDQNSAGTDSRTNAQGLTECEFSQVLRPVKRSIRVMTFISGLIWLVIGGTYVALGWDGLVEWLRIWRLPYREVRNTPYIAVWQSKLGLLGVFSVICGTFSF